MVTIANSVSGIFAVVFIILFITDACLIFFAYIYSRFIFNRYLKIHHRQKWEELVYTDENVGGNWLTYDITSQMRKFRTESNDDLGDPQLNKLRRTSIYLFNMGMWLWLSLLTFIIAAAVLAKLFGE